MRWRRAILAVVAGGAISGSITATVDWMTYLDWAMQGAVRFTPGQLTNRAYWLLVDVGFGAMIGVPSIVAAVLIVGWHRKPRPGHCRSCGYDLTGNTSGRCPECGATV